MYVLIKDKDLVWHSWWQLRESVFKSGQVKAWIVVAGWWWLNEVVVVLGESSNANLNKNAKLKCKVTDSLLGFKE